MQILGSTLHPCRGTSKGPLPCCAPALTRAMLCPDHCNAVPCCAHTGLRTRRTQGKARTPTSPPSRNEAGQHHPCAVSSSIEQSMPPMHTCMDGQAMARVNSQDGYISSPSVVSSPCQHHASQPASAMINGATAADKQAVRNHHACGVGGCTPRIRQRFQDFAVFRAAPGCRSRACTVDSWLPEAQMQSCA